MVFEPSIGSEVFAVYWRNMAFAAFQNENSNSRREPKGCFKFWVDFANSEKKTDSRFNTDREGNPRGKACCHSSVALGP